MTDETIVRSMPLRLFVSIEFPFPNLLELASNRKGLTFFLFGRLE